jgi:hypothetical protein
MPPGTAVVSAISDIDTTDLRLEFRYASDRTSRYVDADRTFSTLAAMLR